MSLTKCIAISELYILRKEFGDIGFTILTFVKRTNISKFNFAIIRIPVRQRITSYYVDFAGWIFVTFIVFLHDFQRNFFTPVHIPAFVIRCLDTYHFF